MPTLRISPDLALPLDVVTATSIVYGGKGMGKSNLASVIMEEASKVGLRWSALDPMGVLWGIRHSADGKSPGVPCVILGGPHGDIPIQPMGGAVVADLVVDEHVNTIIDISRHANGTMWSKADRIRFVTDYTKRLFERQGGLVDGRRREPILQILDEAARFIPQTIPANSPMLAECVGNWEQIVEEGRNIGIGVALITQRSARMNKSVSELADVMFAFRTGGPNSLAAIMDWLGEHVEKSRVKDVAEKVRSLAIGQALVVSPGWLRMEKIATIRLRETFDSSATPKPGERAKRVTGRAAKPDLAAYEARMVASIEQAKANDPKFLQVELARLKKENAQLATAVGKVTSSPDLKRAMDVEYQRGLADGDQRGFARAVRTFQATLGKGQRQLKALVGVVKLLPDKLEELVATLTIDDASAAARVQEMPVVSIPNARAPYRPITTVTQRPAGIATAVSSDIGGGEQRVLNALAELRAIGIDPATRDQVGVFAGYNLSGGRPAGYASAVIAKGLVASPGAGLMSLTDAGLASANAAGRPASLSELHQRVLNRLDGGERKILEHLLRVYPSAQSRDDVGAAVEYNLAGGRPAGYVSTLTTLGFADKPGNGMLVAGALLYPEGLV